MKIIIFGMGEIYRQNKNNISKDDEIIAFIDNNEQLQGTKCNGIEIHKPIEISQLDFDKVVIMSMYFNEMRNQLLQMGCKRECILYYIEYISQQAAGQLCVYYGKKAYFAEKTCLIITNVLNYTGGAMAAVYAAMELQNRGYEVVVAAAEGDKKFIDEFNKKGIIFLVYYNLQFAKWDELFWIKNFDKIIVNTYPMTLCAIEISKHRKVTVWLHESDTVYSSLNFWKDIILESISNPNLMKYAVSSVARKNFFNNITECEIGLLPYGIPDTNKRTVEASEKLTFAVIGTIHPIKQQLLFLEAVKQLNELKHNCEYLIIGRDGDAEYVQMVEIETKEISNVYITGELTRKELERLYSQIDIVVIPSSQETMSLTATEAMMYGKVCILSDVTGMAEYVKHGVNGLIFKSNDVDDLVNQMFYCTENTENLQKLRENARKTYIQYFSMDVFGNRLEYTLCQQDRTLYQING